MELDLISTDQLVEILERQEQSVPSVGRLLIDCLTHRISLFIFV